MISYAERECFNASELRHLRLATRFVSKLEDTEQNRLRCHELARAVGRVLDLPVQDGYFEHIQHSWLWTRTLPEPPFFYTQELPNILDVYVPGSIPQVQLINWATSTLPARKTYLWSVPMKPDNIDEELVDVLAEMMKADLEVT